MFEEDDEHGDCRQCLLTIVARGTAIITEIYRLVELIPKPFQDAGRKQMSKQDIYNYSEIICDFSYFNNIEAFETRIETNQILKRADEQLCEDNFDILTRFYLTFEAVQRHASDLNKFILDLEDETFIGQSLEGLLNDCEDCQLLCEAHFQMGYMLLLIDSSLDGDLRERLITSYYRYSSYKSSPSTNLDETCNLMRSTGFKCDRQRVFATKANNHKHENCQTIRPPGYPESLFARININQSVVGMLISKLQAVDIYNQTYAIFPHPDHRSNALSQQAAILYVLLYFCPSILKTQRSRMREITDKFFSDNWVVHIFMGEYVNLIEMWEPYRAASESVIQIHEAESVKSLSSQFNIRFNRNAKQLDKYLTEGWLDEESFIEHSGRILNCLRDSNVVLKWLLLHSRLRDAWKTNRLIKTLSSIVIADKPESSKLYEFFQNVCILEEKVSLLYDQISVVKQTRVQLNKSQACDMLNELVCIFNDSKPMRWVKVGANKGLAKILAEVQDQLAELDLSTVVNATSSTVLVRQINRIESARESYSDGKSSQVVQLFTDIKDGLVVLLKYLNLTEDFKMTLQSVGDFSYGWMLMGEIFTQPMQQVIKDNPESMFGFQAVVKKLTYAFEPQLVRIQQINAKTDLISVSHYYSSKLVSYITNVLQIIPATIMGLISPMVSAPVYSKWTDVWMPSRVHLDQLKDFAMPEQRLQMIQLTCKISHYARGIMSMPNTVVGLMRLNSKKMLEEGMRQELYTCISTCIEETLNSKASGGTLFERLGRLDLTLNAFQRSFQYIQDFLTIYGLKMWQEELNRSVRDAFEQAMTSIENESNQCDTDHLGSTHSKAETLDESYRSTTNFRTRCFGDINALKLKSTDTSFMLSILKEVLELTSAHEAVFNEQANVWVSRKSQHQVLDPSRLIRLIGSSLGVAGLNSFDRLCSTILMLELDCVSIVLSEPSQKQGNKSTRGNTLLEMLYALDQVVKSSEWPPINLPDESSLKRLILSIFFARLNQRPSAGFSATSITAQNRRLTDLLLSIGRLQILRQNIQCALSNGCRYEARHLHACLAALNSALLSTVRHGKRSPTQQKTSIDHGTDVVAKANDETDIDDDGVGDHTNRKSDASIDESQLLFELANYLEWIGLSDPLNKIYTLSLQRNRSDESTPSSMSERSFHGFDGFSQKSAHLNSDHSTAIYHTALEHSARLKCSLSPSMTNCAATKLCPPCPYTDDGQLLYLGLVTLLNHFQTNIIV